MRRAWAKLFEQQVRREFDQEELERGRGTENMSWAEFIGDLRSVEHKHAGLARSGVSLRQCLEGSLGMECSWEVLVALGRLLPGLWEAPEMLGRDSCEVPERSLGWLKK